MNSRPKVFDFKVSQPNDWENEIKKELEINLGLRRNFDAVRVAFVSSFFNLAPDEYCVSDKESLLTFSEAEFENNKILSSETDNGVCVIYGISQPLSEKLKELYPYVRFFHSGKVFLDAVTKTVEPTVHLNLIHNNLEILVVRSSHILFYNLFETQTGEDILFYSLFVIEQLNLDSNKVEVKTYGELLFDTKVFQILKKYVRHINQGLKDDVYLKNFSLYNLSKCE